LIEFKDHDRLLSRLKVAQHPDSSSCLLSVKRYNDFVKYISIPQLVSLDTARAQAVRSILKDLYMVKKARSTGYVTSNSCAFQKKEWMLGLSKSLKIKKLTGRPVVDVHMLWRAYSTYYDAFFTRRQYQFFSLIGSDDSLYIDSIARSLRGINQDKKVDKSMPRVKTDLSEKTVFCWSN
jgi:hypothetical protein